MQQNETWSNVVLSLSVRIIIGVKRPMRCTKWLRHSVFFYLYAASLRIPICCEETVYCIQCHSQLQALQSCDFLPSVPALSAAFPATIM